MTVSYRISWTYWHSWYQCESVPFFLLANIYYLKKCLFFHACNKLYATHCCVLSIFNRKQQFQITEMNKRIIHLYRKSDFNEIIINIYIKYHLNLKRHANIILWTPQDFLKLQFWRIILFSFRSSLVSAQVFTVLFENGFSFLLQMFTEQTQNMVDK